MFDKNQFKDLIERTLISYNPKLCVDGAINLLLGTAAQESYFGTYLRQIGGGPALGVFQMEPATFIWLRDHYVERPPFNMTDLAERIAEELEWDLQLAILMARLRYWIVPRALPDANDIEGLARYWKDYYNTRFGQGTTEEFVENYKKFVE